MTADVPAQLPPDPVDAALRMRASDADRERVAGILRDAYADGRLTAVEHEERLSETYRATTYGELAPVLRDLPVPPGTLAVPSASGVGIASPSPVTGGALTIHPGRATQGEGSSVAIFGAFERRGSWVVSQEITVPDGMAVRNEAVGIFGGSSMPPGSPEPGAPVLVIKGAAIFGRIDVHRPKGSPRGGSSR